MGDDWRAPMFRQNMVAKIEEAIKLVGSPTLKNSAEMENHVYLKAKTKEEYLGLVARLLIHVNNKKAGNMNQQNQGMQDPINALQNLTQGSRNNQMMGMSPQPNMNASSLLQTLNQRPMQSMGKMMPNQMMNQMQPMQQNQMMQNPMGNQMMQNQMGVLASQLQQPMMNNQMMMHMQRKPDMINYQTRTVTPNPYMRQSPTPMVHSPGMSGPPSNQMNQMIPSPALVPSPGSQMSMMSGPPRSVGMAPSPGSSLNTPGQAVPIPSPLGVPEEQVYRDKVRQLSKYIEPLKKMIARMGTEGEPSEKTSKMKNLLDFLQNPSKRMPLETILKCEIVLERMDWKRNEGGSVANTTQLTALKEHYIFNPLLEAINNSLSSAVFNHTLQRTFGPSTEALNGPEIKGLPPPLKRKRIEEPTSDIPDVLQGEIARLDTRFKVSLDQMQKPGSKNIQLICWLDDRHLPCVPPVALSVAEDYPKKPPVCHMAETEYTATKFLTAVHTIMLNRLGKLPQWYSVTELLHTWEMSVRQAASHQQSTQVSAATVLLGM